MMNYPLNTTIYIAQLEKNTQYSYIIWVFYTQFWAPYTATMILF